MSWNAPANAFDMGDMSQAVNGAADTDGITQHENGHDGSAAGQDSERVGGWVARTPLNYEALGADRDTAHIHEESGAIPVWAHNAAKYEWVDEYGDVGPRVPDLEDELFRSGKAHVSQAGVDIGAYNEIPVEIEGGEKVRPIQAFADAGFHPTMLENLQLCMYNGPTPIQAYSIPAVLTGNDLVAVAQTGSGKTAAFLVPILSRLMGKAKKLAAARPNPLRYNPASDAVRAEPLVLIMCPTRELAMQIFDDARRFCYRSMLRPACLYGGAPKREQIEELKRGCDVLIGTPGRLKDVVENEPRWLSLDRLKYTVIDEADELLQDDWEEEMKPLLGGGASSMEGDHQFLLFSATFPKQARALAKQYLDPDHVRIKVGRTGSTLKNIRQDVIWVEGNMKQKALIELLEDLPPARTLIFCNNTGTVDVVDDFLYNAKMPVTSIHRERTQREREDAIRAFRTGKVPILVASAVSARGLDIRSIMHVINYDLPSTMYGGINEYVHRIGRTGRIGNQGQATSFYNERDEGLAPDLVKLLLENQQPIPDFLEQYKPEECAAIDWDDASLDGEDAEDAGENGDAGDAGDAGGGGWGNESGASAAEPATADDGWGAPAAPATAPVTAPAAALAASTNDGWDAPSGQDLSW